MTIDITCTAHFILRKALSRYERMATHETMKTLVESILYPMVKANCKYSN